jgi:hypothetical protein
VEADQEAKDVAAFVHEVAQLSKQLLTMGFEDTLCPQLDNVTSET